MRRLAAWAVMLASAVALADVIPPDVASCQGKSVEDRCTLDDGQAGTCAEAMCSKNDYSEGPPPKQVEVVCLKCLPPKQSSRPLPGEEKPKGTCAAVPGLTLAGLAALVAAFTRKRR